MKVMSMLLVITTIAPPAFAQAQVQGDAWRPFAQKLDVGTGKRESFYPWEQNQRNAMGHIFILYKDRSGTLWIGSNGYGLLRHNTFSEKFHHTDHYSVIRMQPIAARRFAPRLPAVLLAVAIPTVLNRADDPPHGDEAMPPMRISPSTV